MKERIALVCQRYGLEVNGGAELYCRLLAEKMLSVYEVDVYTTCAVNYVTWANSYKPGTENIHGVTVHRFPVTKLRDQDAFIQFSGELLQKKSRQSDEDESKWIDMQGPVCPMLLDALYADRKAYKAILFITYLYYPTVEGLGLGLDNAYLVPTAHDEPWIYLRCFDRVFDKAKGLIYLTYEEKSFAEKRFPQIKSKPNVITGAGIDLPESDLPDIPEQIKTVPYIVYAGRIDETKGCREMFDFFLRYKRAYGGELKLVLMGKAAIEIPDDPDVIHLGFVSDEMKFAVMRGAKALTLFSHFESLSMVVLESMAIGRPVLVSGKCEVLKGHCLRSNAGLYFDNYAEFAGTLNYLLTHEEVYEAMCENGKRYVDENYQWDVIVKRICGLIG